jgi:hypothetical protein
MAVPALPAADFIVVQTHLAFGQLEHFLNGPTGPSRPDHLLHRAVHRGVYQIIGHLLGAEEMTPDQQGVDPALLQGRT